MDILLLGKTDLVVWFLLYNRISWPSFLGGKLARQTLFLPEKLFAIWRVKVCGDHQSKMRHLLNTLLLIFFHAFVSLTESFSTASVTSFVKVDSFSAVASSSESSGSGLHERTARSN